MPPVEFIHGEQDRWNCRTLRNVLVLDKGPHYKTLINSSMLTNLEDLKSQLQDAERINEIQCNHRLSVSMLSASSAKQSQ